MSRLTDRTNSLTFVKNAGVYTCKNVCEKEDCECRECPIQEAFDKLAHYEDLEEAGRLIEIPCTESDEEEFQVVVTMVSKDKSKAFIVLDATEPKIEVLDKCIREIFEISKAKLEEMGGGCDE